MTAKREKFRLNILGADEDLPRLVAAYGRGCGGEVALVLRPRDAEGILIHQLKKQPAKVWTTERRLLPGTATERDKLATDAPSQPTTDVPSADAVTMLRRLKAAPPAKGPASLRGTWRGQLLCTDGVPTVHLERKVASYGILRVHSDPAGHWHASFERDVRWFSSAKRDEAPEAPTLAEAIQRGMVQMTGLVSEACSFRDTRRRNAVDADYAVAHPPRDVKDPKDPTERYQPRSHFRVEAVPTGFDVVNEAGVAVARFGGREKGKAEKHAAGLNRGAVPQGTETVPPRTAPLAPDSSPWEERYEQAMRTAGPGNWRALTVLYASPDDANTQAALSAWLDKYATNSEDAKVLLDGRDNAGEAGIRDHAYDEIARRLQFKPIPKGSRPKAPPPAATAMPDRVPYAQVGVTIPPALTEITAPESPACQVSAQRIAAATQKEAAALEDLSESLWGTTEGPALLARAARLLRHAEALVKSPACKGPERQAAWEELKRAAEAYNAARDAIVRGESPDLVTALRRVAERIGLAAARAGKSCGGAPAPTTPTPTEAPPRQRRRKVVTPPATPATAPKSKPGRKPKAEDEGAAPAPEVDAEKDAALVNAFAAAVQAAAKQMKEAA